MSLKQIIQNYQENLKKQRLQRINDKTSRPPGLEPLTFQNNAINGSLFSPRLN
jgi:hypothetical protein